MPPPFPVPQPAPPPPKPKINARSKGQRGERQVVKLLQVVVDRVRVSRGLPPIVLQRNALQAHLGGEDIHGLDGFSVEVKWQEIGYSPAWWQQCLTQAERSKASPILFFRASQQKWSIKFRAFVNTPLDRDQIEMDLVTNIDDFIEWFATAYDERLALEQSYVGSSL
jgi:hypothetical protein